MRLTLGELRCISGFIMEVRSPCSLSLCREVFHGVELAIVAE